MVFSSEHQLEIPGEFPSSENASFMLAARNILINPEVAEIWKDFAGACNIVGWRFRTCHEEMRKFIESWRQHGSAISFEEIYLRERALFIMFCSGVSCLESMCFAINALASYSKLLNFPFSEKEQRACTPAQLQKTLDKHPNAAILSKELKNIIDSDEWKIWTSLRNRMTHRSSLPPVGHGASSGHPITTRALDFAETASTRKIEEDIEFLEKLFSWLSQAIKNLLVAGTSFATQP
ncbi:hypothetical protein [Pseudomonas tohonis]|uniref:hypothetical protein n=1 Tax=Pseudomonas tohonis TaxID=2725477 RepID=UPI0022F00527|nr:hypothetical protein [Pseudomonas tohonis]